MAIITNKVVPLSVTDKIPIINCSEFKETKPINHRGSSHHLKFDKQIMKKAVPSPLHSHFKGLYESMLRLFYLSAVQVSSIIFLNTSQIMVDIKMGRISLTG
ncbi:hypothetical protein RF11_02476 [Thelohanellus kitauei]|uniref:Uncharacterized protein n=1 Tax=Thelohanellus kitauei TaxID=669202 RepID=A0A0C2N1L7_THEKT|nr:hypothetical protein RF11_02476 [Thelohanellus kitauei]